MLSRCVIMQRDILQMENLDKTIKRLQEIIVDPNCRNMNFSNIKGYLGELFVAQKLISEGFEINLTGNQSGHDIEIPKLKIAIDVKFSTIKTEIKGCPNYWGWALKSKNKKRSISCTHFVCVAADETLNPVSYFLINASHLNEFPEYGIEQFKNVENGFMLLKNNDDLEKITKPIMKLNFQLNQQLLQAGKARELTHFTKVFSTTFFPDKSPLQHL